MTAAKSRTDVLDIARKRWEIVEEAEREIREPMLDDLRMRAGDQWSATDRALRTADRRPCLTVNRLPQFVRQVCNDQRQNRPAVQVNPVDDQGDPKTAEVLQGLIRHIEYDSGASAAYDTAFEHATTSGRGFFRVVTEYSTPDSFDLDIKIKRIRDQFSVYMDPEAREPDRSDARWCFIVDTLTREDFEALYPDSDIAKGGSTGWDEARSAAPNWMEGKGIRIAEYFSVETRRDTLHLLSDNSTATGAELRALTNGDKAVEASLVVKSRPVDVPTVMWRKLTGAEILEETVWPGRWIPVLTVLGDELEIDGKLTLEGVIRHAKDTQRMLNYWVSAETESIALAPKAPYIVAEGQLEGYTKDWRASNTKNLAYLTYKPVTLAGVPVAPPARQFGEPNVGAITNARMQCQDDLKALTGIFDASMGAQSNETSGRAILARQRQSSTANFHLMDNLTRTLRHLGRILVDLIPKVYDTARVVRVIGEDGEQQTVPVNREFVEDGVAKIYDLSTGRYDVTISSGPSYETKRQEAVASMLELTRTIPALQAVAPDLLVKSMDWPGAEKIAERLRRTLDPKLVDDKPQQADPRLEQMGQMLDQLAAKLSEAQEQLASKHMELESKERIAEINARVELLKTLATLEQKDAQAQMDVQMQAIQSSLNALGNLPSLPMEFSAAPMAGGGPMEPATSGETLGNYDAGLMPAPDQGQLEASDPGPSMETP